MAYITITLSYTATSLTEFANGIFMSNTKTQKNPFTDEIEEYGVSGDIAGILVSNFNSSEFSEIQGTNESEIKNCLSIEEFTESEYKTLQKQSINVISRAGSIFYFKGNKINGVDELNIRIIRTFIAGELESFLEEKIFEETNFSAEISAKMEQIKKKVKRYMASFSYDYSEENREVTINLNETMNKPLDKMRFLISFNMEK